MKIYTNNQPRDFIDPSDLTEEERERFDYVDMASAHGEFLRYQGHAYHLSEFIRIEPPGIAGSPSAIRVTEDSLFCGWHGVAADSYFSGVLIRIIDDAEQAVLGRYTS